MRVHQREGGVVADGADVAEMVGEALELGHQRAQPDARAAAARARAPPRRRARRRARRRPCCRRRCGRRASRRARVGAPTIRLLDALVHVAQPLLQPHDGLAVGGEAEMAGLDDAGVHRPDRDLVQRRALARRGTRRHRRRPAPAAGSPSGWRSPSGRDRARGASSGSPRLQAVQVADGALQPQRRRMRARDRGKAAARGRAG